ncbi:DUF3135 domain-containing protein [Thaumasiovibrio subtropicus]|uniref:DUF3135 domain-containing protein n=1 Tax=Thaumasiovibrio subtropicus TaxID=1891207 RepID=UPI000B34B8FB|nr:DUF3135 domain-containing protein [Thaumasiovibrio subtropicus]
MQKLPSFDEMMHMAEHHPDQLEALRTRMSEEVIDRANDAMKPRLRAQMSHIRRVISYSKNPNHANVLLMGELQTQLHRFSLALNDPAQLREHQAEVFEIQFHS